MRATCGVLLGEPRLPGNKKAFEHAQHLLKKIPGRPELVREDRLAEFAESVAEEITRHSDEPTAAVREEPPEQ